MLQILAWWGAQPRGRFDVTIALAAAESGDRERDTTLRGADFFDVERTPEARYVATRFARLPDGWVVALELGADSRPSRCTARRWTPVPLLVRQCQMSKFKV